MALKVKISPEKIPNRDQPLSIHKLSVKLSGAPVLNEVSFEIGSGEILGIVGRNGAGKTTLVSTIAGTLDVSSTGIEYSHALVDSSDFMDMSPEKRYEQGIHCVFEGRKLFSELTVRENLEIVMPGFSKRKARARVKDVVELFPKMEELLDKKAKHCSGGQQQVVAIARSIMVFPTVLILDEPTLGLSPKAIQAVGEVLKVLVSGSVSVLVCEQRDSFVSDIADRKLILESGRISEPLIESSRATEWKPQ